MTHDEVMALLSPRGPVVSIMYSGPCNSLHGHNAKIEVRLIGEVQPTSGMVVDFSRLGLLGIHAWLAEIDHAVLLNRNDPMKSELLKTHNRVVLFNEEPTAENLAMSLKRAICAKGIQSSNVTVRFWETEDSWAEV